jgi:pimeloyl-ACP methyl ester carboxylesterase
MSDTTIDMFHEVHGEGFPTILLHGAIGASEMFGPAVDRLAEGRQVIAAHLQGHGRTPDVADRPLRYEHLGDDVAALAARLGHAQVDLVGYSLGGGAAVQCALRHPGLVRRLVVVGEPLRSDAWFPEVREQLAGMQDAAPQIGAAVQAGPLGELHPDVDFPTLFAKVGELERQPYDWTDAFATVASEVMLVMADADGFDPGHYLDVYRSLGGALRDPGLPDQGGEPHIAHQLAIVPGVTHYDTFNATPRAAELIADFLDTA